MIALKGVIKDGQVILRQRVDLPDGTEVKILPVGQPESENDDTGLDPEQIAQLLALMDQVQPFEMTNEERAAWEADRKARKEWEKAHFDEHAEKLGKDWQ
jgi:hypothetical protein